MSLGSQRRRRPPPLPVDPSVPASGYQACPAAVPATAQIKPSRPCVVRNWVSWIPASRHRAARKDVRTLRLPNEPGEEMRRNVYNVKRAEPLKRAVSLRGFIHYQIHQTGVIYTCQKCGVQIRIEQVNILSSGDHKCIAPPINNMTVPQ